MAVHTKQTHSGNNRCNTKAWWNTVTLKQRGEHNPDSLGHKPMTEQGQRQDMNQNQSKGNINKNTTKAEF